MFFAFLIKKNRLLEVSIRLPRGPHRTFFILLKSGLINKVNIIITSRVAKVMFSQASVCSTLGGGGSALEGRQTPGKEDPPPGRQNPPPPRNADPPPPPPPKEGRVLGNTVNEREVRIPTGMHSCLLNNIGLR